MLKKIQDTLLRLKPTGPHGFEGLIGEIIHEITDIPCRLAKSGTQFGIDGDAIFPTDALCFEAKLYSGKLPKDQIITKVATLAINKDEADILWVLGATTPVASQDATSLHKIASKDGISVLILDWQDQSLPLLAVSLAMAKDRVIPWLVEKLKDQSLQKTLTVAFDKLTKHKDYLQISEKLRNQFNAVELATANAKRENTDWLTAVFSKKSEARSKFGQPVAPLSNPEMTLPRNEVTQKVGAGLADQKTVFLLGDEGCGKSWVSSSAIKSFAGLSIFVSAEHLKDRTTESDIQALIIETLANQCGEVAIEKTIKRWNRRFDAWAASPSPQRLLVVLDGLNQRPDLAWDKIILRLQNILSRIGGCLIVTTRKKLFQDKIKKGLVGSFIEIPVDDWTEQERDILLQRNGISVNNLDSITAKSLRNPRLLGIAIEILPKGNPEAWRGLTTDRLLFEHIRLSQRDNIEPDTADVLADRLSKQARDVLDRLPSNNLQTALIFQSDTDHVAEGRFFEAVSGPGQHYKLKEQGLTLALGYALVDRIWDAQRAESDLEETLTRLLEPISSLDRTSEVILAALTVCALDDVRFQEEIFRTILGGFSTMQNPDTQKYHAFRDICFSRFGAFLLALEDCLLDQNRRLNQNWLTEVTRDSKADATKWEILTAAIDRWLGYYSKAPDHRLRMYPRHEGDKREEEISKKAKEIQVALDTLSPTEIKFFAEMTEMDGSISELTKFGMELLAKKPLAPFTRSFIKWGISLGINLDLGAPTKEFQSLTNFNQIDWQDMCNAFRDAISQFDSSDISRGGKWTFVRMLFATGTSADADRAIEVATELRKDWPKFDAWSRIEQMCASDPCDPSSVEPENLADTAKQYANIDVEKLYLSMGSGEQDHFRKEALSGLARFKPEVALAKHEELLETLLTRVEFPLRQLSLNGTFLQPLVSNKLAVKIFSELQTGKNLNSVSEVDRVAVGMHFLWFAFSHLSAAQQLDAMSLPVFKGSYLLAIIPCLKPFDGDVFTKRFSAVCRTGETEDIFPALAFLQHTQTEMSEETKELTISLMSHDASLVRAGAFEVILEKGIIEGIRHHCDADWSFDRAEETDDSRKYEIWYGSLLLVEGVKRGLISFADAFERCSMATWISSVKSLDSEDQSAISNAMDAAFDVLFQSAEQIEQPAFELTITSSKFGAPQRYSINVSQEDNNSRDIVDIQNETPEDFKKRQKSLQDAFDTFSSKLDRSTSILILDRLNFSDFDQIATIAPHLIEKWATRLLSSSDTEARLVQNLFYLVAKSRSEKAPEEAIALLHKASLVEGFITVTYESGLTAEHIACWDASRAEPLEAMSRDRINSASNNNELALEVLAAEKCGRYEFIQDYVNTGLQNEHPYVQARAIMVAGFSSQTDVFAEQLKSLAPKKGITGEAAKIAIEAHKRHIWTKHWAEKMILSASTQEFWCASILMTKVSDGRLGQFINTQESYGDFWPEYSDVVEHETKTRSNKWIKKRKEAFLGGKKVDEIFL